MSPIEIVVAVACALIVGSVAIGVAVGAMRRKRRGIPPGCAGCSRLKGCRGPGPDASCEKNDPQDSDFAGN